MQWKVELLCTSLTIPTNWYHWRDTYPFFCGKIVIFGDWYLIKASGQTLHHIYVFIS